MAPLALLGMVPRGVWFGVAGAALLSLGTCAHQRSVKQHYTEAYKAGEAAADAKWQKAFDEMEAAVSQWKTEYEAQTKGLSDELEARYNENARLNRKLADALRLRGPGRAASCGPLRDPGAAALPRNNNAPAEPDAPGPGLPEQDRAIVPWGWLVTRSEEHDDMLEELKARREWDGRVRELHEKLKLELPEIKLSAE